MQADHRVLLAGRDIDTPAIMNSAAQAATRINANNDANALRGLFAQQGPDIMRGDQNALAAYARLDPGAALGIQNDRLLMQTREQAMRIADSQEGRAATEFAMRMDATQRAEALAELEGNLRPIGTAMANGDLDTVNRILATEGIEPVQSLDDTRLLDLVTRMDAVHTAFTRAQEMLQSQQPPEPADEYGRYVQEERAAGREPLSRIDYAQAKRGEETVYGPDGQVILRRGPNETDDALNPMDPSSPAAMLASIDGILNDPALDFSTGWLEWTQNIPGTPARRFGARANQLKGQAFLQAFNNLRGGGHITEIEGQKATDAIARLDTAQSPNDYRSALQELQGILLLGLQRQSQGQTVGEAADALEAGQGPTRREVTLEDGSRFIVIEVE